MMGYIYIYIYIYARSSQLTVKDLKQNKHDRKQLHGALLEDTPAYIYIDTLYTHYQQVCLTA